MLFVREHKARRATARPMMSVFAALALLWALPPMIAFAQQEPDETPEPEPRAQFTYTDRFTVPWTEGKFLSVKESDGQILARAGAADSVTFRAGKTALAPDLAAARRFAANIKITAEAPADSLTASSVIPATLGGAISARVDYDILAPSAIPIRFETSNGLIDIAGFSGGATVKTESGNIRMKDVKGAVKASSESGKIEVRDCPDTIEIRSKSGEIVFSAARLDSKEVYIASETGDISVSLRRSLKVRIDARAASGAIDTADANMKTVSEESGSIVFETPGGAPPATNITIIAVSGNIVISNN